MVSHELIHETSPEFSSANSFTLVRGLLYWHACRRFLRLQGELQEVDLQRHHSRLVNAGRLEQMAGANLRPRRMRTFEESVVAFEVGKIQTFCLRVRGFMPWSNARLHLQVPRM